MQAKSENILLSLVFTTNSPKLYGLREGSNSCGWKDRKVQFLLLGIKPRTHIRGTTVVGSLQSSSLGMQKWQWPIRIRQIL